MQAVEQANALPLSKAFGGRPHDEITRAAAVLGVLVIEDDLLRREGLERLLSEHSRDLVVQSAARMSDATMECPDLIILGLKAGDVGWASEQLAMILQRYDGLPIVALAHGQADFESAADAIRHGLRGYIVTSAGINVAVAAIRLVLAGGIYFPGELIDTRPRSGFDLGDDSFRSSKDPRLTAREDEVLMALRQGITNRNIGKLLDISENTVKIHVRNIMRKLNVENRTQIALATREQKASKNILVTT